MASKTSFNSRSQGVKRILQEAKELSTDSPAEFWAAPTEDNLFEWHFVVRVDHAEFKNGLYHGRIILPPEYPMRPPDIILLTPNGRFELQKKICLSITGYHEDLWQPAWGIRTALMALVAFFATEAKGAVGSLDVAPAERTYLAEKSHSWTCSKCSLSNAELLPPRTQPQPQSSSSLSLSSSSSPPPPLSPSLQSIPQSSPASRVPPSSFPQHDPSNIPSSYSNTNPHPIQQVTSPSPSSHTPPHYDNIATHPTTTTESEEHSIKTPFLDFSILIVGLAILVLALRNVLL